MSDPKQLLIDVLRAKDAGRARSKQTQVGPSELGGCRRKVWYRLNDLPFSLLLFLLCTRATIEMNHYLGYQIKT